MMSPSIRSAARGAAFVPLMLAGCFTGSEVPERVVDWVLAIDSAGRRPVLSYSQAPLRSVMDVRSDEMLSVVREGYHPRPDRRFLLALAFLDNLLTGRPLGEVSSAYEDGAWSVAYGGTPVGTLPELADLDDAMGLLTAHARASTARVPLPPPGPEVEDALTQARTALAAFGASDVAEGLRRLDGLWRKGDRNAAVPVLAAQGLSALYLQSYDRLELGDAVPAKALAAIVAARHLAGPGLAEEEALVSFHMGYTRHADSVAATLPIGNPTALYVRGEGDGLRLLAEGEGASALTRYLFTLHLSATAPADSLSRWTGDFGLEPAVFGLAQLKPLFQTGDYEVSAELAGLGPYVALYDLWKTVLPGEAMREQADAKVSRLSLEAVEVAGLAIRESAGVPQAALARRFQKDLRLLDLRFEGPFLDAETYGNYFAAAFYSAQYKLARHILDGYGSVPAAQAFAASLEGAPSGPAAELDRWYRHLTEAAAGRPSVPELLSDLASLELLGMSAVRRSYEEIDRQVPFSDPTRMLAGKMYLSHLDARPINRQEVRGVLRDDLKDLNRLPDYHRGILDMSSRPGRMDMWVAHYAGDVDRLVRQVRDPALDVEDRMVGWSILQVWGHLEDRRLRVLAREILESDGNSWPAAHQYVRYLEGVGGLEEGLDLVNGWLSRHGPEDGAPYWSAKTDRARLLHRMGRTQAALADVEPLMMGELVEPVLAGARILQDMGRGDEARTHATRLVERFPGNDRARVLLAEVLWRQDDLVGAAGALAAEGYAIDDGVWREDAAVAFQGAFATGSPEGAERGQRAMEALISAGLPFWELEALTEGIVRRGDTRLALTAQLALVSAFVPRSAAPRADVSWLRLLVPAYWWMKTVRGPEPAMEWLLQSIGPGLTNPFGMTAYGEGAHELFWSVVTDPDQGEAPSFYWLLRAASYVSSPGTAPRGAGAALAAHYRTIDASDPYSVLGGYLMGAVDEATVLALAEDPGIRCEAAYYLGLKAAAEGREADAVDWFRVAIETGQSREGEYHWALRELTHRQDAAVPVGRVDP